MTFAIMLGQQAAIKMVFLFFAVRPLRFNVFHSSADPFPSIHCRHPSLKRAFLGAVGFSLSLLAFGATS
jgi:hypothetical protein